jgi:hypothetical protein
VKKELTVKEERRMRAIKGVREEKEETEKENLNKEQRFVNSQHGPVAVVRIF